MIVPLFCPYCSPVAKLSLKLIRFLSSFHCSVRSATLRGWQKKKKNVFINLKIRWKKKIAKIIDKCSNFLLNVNTELDTFRHTIISFVVSSIK